MARYFFDYFNGEALDQDQDGLELPDAEAAFLEAFKAATEMWGESVRERRNPIFDYFQIRDQSGVVVLELPFAEVLESSRGRRQRPPVRLDKSEALRAHDRVERGRKLVEDQRDRLERLKARRSDTTEAERTLDTFTSVLVTFESILNSVQAIRRTAS
jgi:hypothetical protein